MIATPKDENEIVVSVFCAVYNHEDYLRSTLDAFLNQNTDFNFEVIINDDASTDGSRQIIQEYAKKYPNIIKPIYQTENQYSKGVAIINSIMLPDAKGRYFAWCEGDDCWIDSQKLQTQVDALRNHPECTLCAHTVQIENGGRITGTFPKNTASGIYSTIEALELGYLQTSSFLIKAEDYQNYVSYTKEKPEIWGSEAIQMYMKLEGKLLFIDKEMSKYRYLTPGSWTDSQSKNIENQIENRLRFIKMLYAFNTYSKKEYEMYFKRRINSDVLSYLILKDKQKRILNDEYIHIRKMLYVKNRCKVWLWNHFERLYYRLIND